MITDREYPATHSMNTSWFGIDRDGNVALLDFNANGPVPYGCDEWSPEYIITEQLTSYDSAGIPVLNYTPSQAIALEKDFTPPTTDNLTSKSIVKVNLSTDNNIKEFLQLCISNHSTPSEPQYIVVCEELGIYIVDFYDWNANDIKYIIDNNILSGVKLFWIDTNDTWNSEIKAYEFSNNMQGYPYFLYQQPYAEDRLSQQTHVPAHPYKESQLSKKAQESALRFPISFFETTEIQFAEYLQCKSSNTVIRTDYEGIRAVKKDILPISNNRLALIRRLTTGELDCEKCGVCKLRNTPVSYYTQYETYQYGLFPTIIHIFSPKGFSSMPYEPYTFWNTPYRELFCDIRNLSRIISIPVIPGRPEADDLDLQATPKDIRKWFRNCMANFEETVRLLSPKAFIVAEHSHRIIQDFYSIANQTITIGSNTYPYFILNGQSDFIQHLIHLSRLPYDGVIVSRIEPLDNLPII